MPKKVKIEQEITIDYILDQYNRIKKIKNKAEKDEELKALKELSKNLGGYLVEK